MDGNSIANRLAASLCSGSVVLLSQLFCEWFAFRLQPGKHFVPIRQVSREGREKQACEAGYSPAQVARLASLDWAGRLTCSRLALCSPVTLAPRQPATAGLPDF